MTSTIHNGHPKTTLQDWKSSPRANAHLRRRAQRKWPDLGKMVIITIIVIAVALSYRTTPHKELPSDAAMNANFDVQPSNDPAPLAKQSDDFYAIRPATVDCVIQAAQKQRVPANILLALASVENGKNGQYVGNTNGSQDIGHFQINTIHWKRGGRFAKYPSITQQNVAWRGCYNAEIAAWLLRQSISEPTGQEFWTRVANYHSKTPAYNAAYRRKVIPLAVQWGKWLEQRNKQVSVSQK